jgi:hypothetical protein
MRVCVVSKGEAYSIDTPESYILVDARDDMFCFDLLKLFQTIILQNVDPSQHGKAVCDALKHAVRGASVVIILDANGDDQVNE